MESKHEPHPVVALLLARMESNPEEFVVDDSTLKGATRRLTLPYPAVSRWNDAVYKIRECASKEDLELFNSALSKVVLDKVYADVMDELLNGDERRAQALKAEQGLQAMQAQLGAPTAGLLSNTTTTALQDPLNVYSTLSSNTRFMHSDGTNWVDVDDLVNQVKAKKGESGWLKKLLR